MAHQKHKIKGNIASVKKSWLAALEDMFDAVYDADELIPAENLDVIAKITASTNREIALYLNRKGRIIDILMGSAENVSLPEIEGREGRRHEKKLSGIRCVHTHPGSDGKPSEADISSLQALRLDAMVSVGISPAGAICEIYAAVPVLDRAAAFTKVKILGPFHEDSAELKTILRDIIEQEQIALETPASRSTGNEKERAVLVGIETKETEVWMAELEELAKTAGAEVVGTIVQKKHTRDPAFLIGKGKAFELSLLCQDLKADVVIFDDDLSGAQIRNLEEEVGVKVVDRTMLILDIFAKRARTNEGKIQVEIAQLKYRLTRLIGQGLQLSRLGGGIGTRGPGESKLETDRRHIRRRVKSLEDELVKISTARDTRRSARRRDAIPIAAIVGYTNTGKSTLLNKLAGSDVFAENALFATLDPTTRGFRLADGRRILLTDTVGFIRKLPHELVEAFKSTLDEAVYADILIHVADVSSPDVASQIEVAETLLNSLGASGKPEVLVLNKIDLIRGEQRHPMPYNGPSPVVEISAKTGEGLDKLKITIGNLMDQAGFVFGKSEDFKELES